MSTDWYVFCRTCGDTHRFSDANHQDDLMFKLIRHAGAIAGLAALMADGQSYTDVELQAGSYGRISPEWFAQHLGHNLVPIDEYGRCSDECGEFFACGCCAHTGSCKLLKGHDGPHSRERKPSPA